MDVKFSGEFFAVLVHSCAVTGAVDAMLFGDVEMAKCFCNARWDLPEDEWEPYLVASDHSSTLKLNGEGVRYCGWKQELDEGDEFHIHLAKYDERQKSAWLPEKGLEYGKRIVGNSG